MDAITRLFTRHPASVGESYGAHLRVAAGFAGRLLVAAVACAVHALLPFLFTQTGSRAIEALHRDMISHRTRRGEIAEDARAAPASLSVRPNR